MSEEVFNNKLNNFTQVEEEDISSLSEISEPFDPKEIDIDTKNLTLDLLIRRLKADPPEIDLYPEFQRKTDVWDSKRQSRLIESILIRLPLPAFYFDGSNDNKWLVVDGLQRLSTLKKFVIEKKLNLQNLQFLTHLENKNFDQLPREFQRRIEETQIIAYIIKPGTPKEVKFNIFNRINTGGVPLTAQEIRHALNQGKPANFIAELARLEAFKTATGGINPDRMLDRDFVTRFVSFYLLPYTKYEPDLETHLINGMGKISELSENELNSLRNDFNNAMVTAYNIFGNNSFRKLFKRNENKRNPVSKALFEVWSVALAKIDDQNRQQLVEKKDIVIDFFIKMMVEDQEFNRAISQATGDKRRVIYRFSAIEKLIHESLNTHVKEPIHQEF